MDTGSNYFLSLPYEILKEILFNLSVSDILKYRQVHPTFDICWEKFWLQYITNRWSINYLQTVLSFDVKVLTKEEIYHILHRRIGEEPNNISPFVTNWSLAYAIFLENSTLILLNKIFTGGTFFKKYILISKYDKLVTFFDIGNYSYGNILSSTANFYMEEVSDGNLKVNRLKNSKSFPAPITKFHDKVYLNDIDYSDIQIKDITIDNKCLFDVINNFKIVENDIIDNQN
jgi:hypothetical protein